MWSFARTVAIVGIVACRLPVLVGSIECATNGDCATAGSICGVDARCVPGCTETSCVAGARCDAVSGECAGGIFGSVCSADSNCDPPEVVCKAATSTCAAGCVLTGQCPVGLACDRGSGRCCDPDDGNCRATTNEGMGCEDDAACMAPTSICQANACVAGCASAGCNAPLTCDATSGHCIALDCARDTDCDDDSTCTQAGTCKPIGHRSYGACQGGTAVSYDCAKAKSASTFMSCAGTAGPAACPYCIGHSCFEPGLCATNGDCSRGLACIDGLCIAQNPTCPSVASLADVVNGRYAAGKAVCVHATVTSVRSGYDGAIELKLGSSPYLFVDVLPMYEADGVDLPTAGDEITVHGIVRWDEGHGDRELLPVDWIGP